MLTNLKVTIPFLCHLENMALLYITSYQEPIGIASQHTIQNQACLPCTNEQQFYPSSCHYEKCQRKKKSNGEKRENEVHIDHLESNCFLQSQLLIELLVYVNLFFLPC